MKTITNSEYRNDPAISRSDLILLLKNPNDFYNVKYKGKKLEHTQAMLVGSEIHAFLEGAEFKDLIVLPSTTAGQIRFEGNGTQKKLFEDFRESPYFKAEEWDYNTMDDKGKEKYTFFHRTIKSEKDLNENCIAYSSMKKLEAMMEALKKQEFYEDIVLNKNVLKEQSILFDYEGIHLKIRMDGFMVSHKTKTAIIYDYKSTADMNPFSLFESIKLYGYNVQAYMYMLGLSSLEAYENYKIIFRIIFQSKQEPSNCRIIEFKFNEEQGNETMNCLIKEGKCMFEKSLEIYKTYLAEYGETKEWLNKAYMIPLDFHHNMIMNTNNKIVSNYFPCAGDDLLYDFENAELNKIINQKPL